jgi:CelD/BcsL family acetyltransferase involved in cellulose biosynthesis
VEWKRQQLGRQGYPDMFRFAWINEFLEALRPIEGDAFSPLLSTLHAGDELLAVHLALRGDKVVSSWILTFSHEFSKYSPGLILHVELARWAADAGINRIDLCRGENQMKTSLASDAFPVAVGSVDCRFLQRTLTRSYYGLRNLVHATPFREASIQTIRRLRQWITR